MYNSDNRKNIFLTIKLITIPKFGENIKRIDYNCICAVDASK